MLLVSLTSLPSTRIQMGLLSAVLSQVLTLYNRPRSFPHVPLSGDLLN